MTDLISAAGHERPVLQLSEKDNVAVALAALTPGETVRADATVVQSANHVPAGHKIALRPIALGEKVIKYGAPIGSATRAIAPGEHVHAHNLASDYLPTHEPPSHPKGGA
jgi:altronate dehydratase